MQKYIGMVSSDWSQCLSPSGPYDAFIFHFPRIEPDLSSIFKSYTANEISLSQAIRKVQLLLPHPLTQKQMDDYLRQRFQIYKGVGNLIRWCHDHHVLFMINTTGLVGYFQRALELKHIPPFDVLSAHPMLRFDNAANGPDKVIDLFEIDDKASNTAAIAEMFQIPPHKMILMGDSGGDGPHFNWGAKRGATLIGNMTKPSLNAYCREKGISIGHYFGHTYSQNEQISLKKELSYDFQELIGVIGDILGV